MKRFLVIFSILLLCAGALQAQEEQEPTPITYPENTLTVSGVGSAFGAPDIAYLELGVESVNADLTTAFNETAEAMNAVTQALLEANVAQEDIQTTGVNVYPEDQYPQDGTSPAARVYRVRNTVRVVIRDTEQVENVLTTAVDAGANTIYNLSFGIEDTQPLEAEARTVAVTNARTRAQSLADALGVTLGRVVIVGEGMGGATYPIALGRADAGFAIAQPVSAGQLSVDVQVQITFAIEG